MKLNDITKMINKMIKLISKNKFVMLGVIILIVLILSMVKIGKNIEGMTNPIIFNVNLSENDVVTREDDPDNLIPLDDIDSPLQIGDMIISRRYRSAILIVNGSIIKKDDGSEIIITENGYYNITENKYIDDDKMLLWLPKFANSISGLHANDDNILEKYRSIIDAGNGAETGSGTEAGDGAEAGSVTEAGSGAEAGSGTDADGTPGMPEDTTHTPVEGGSGDMDKTNGHTIPKDTKISPRMEDTTDDMRYTRYNVTNNYPQRLPSMEKQVTTIIRQFDPVGYHRHFTLGGNKNSASTITYLNSGPQPYMSHLHV